MISKKSFLKLLESSIDKDNKTEIELCKKELKQIKICQQKKKRNISKYWIKTILKIPSSGNY